MHPAPPEHVTFKPSPVRGFLQRRTFRGGGVGPCSRSAPDGLDLCGKNDRVAPNERKSMVTNFKVPGQLMITEVRSNTRSGQLKRLYLRDAVKSTVMSESVPN